MRMKSGFTKVELLVAVAIVATLGALALPATAKIRESHQRTSCQNNLREMGLALRLYAEENASGRYPYQRVVNCDGDVQASSSIFDASLMYPEYLSDWDLLVCPATKGAKDAVSLWDTPASLQDRSPQSEFAGNGRVDPCEVTQGSYAYTAWAISPNAIREQIRTVGDLRALEESVLTLAKAIRRTRNIETAIKIADADWRLDAAIGGVTEFPRLRKGIERFVIDEAKNTGASERTGSIIPVMWDTIGDRRPRFNHESGGANVLYLDGHVAFTRYEGPYAGEFPVNAGGMILHNLSASNNRYPG